MLRGTVYLHNRLMAVDAEHESVARSVVSLDVDTEDAFKAECERRAAARPKVLGLEVGNVCEFGPIGPPWSLS